MAEKKVGDKTSLYCPDCEEEQTFVWTARGNEVFFGYPSVEELGWECSVCGCRLRDT